MIELSPQTEVLARRLAEAEDRTLHETIRLALQAREASCAGSAVEGFTPDIVAARIVRLRAIAEEIAILPDLDPRSIEAIVDDINAL